MYEQQMFDSECLQKYVLNSDPFTMLSPFILFYDKTVGRCSSPQSVSGLDSV